MKISSLFKPVDNLPSGSGGGYVLPGYKTYIIGFLSQLTGLIIAKYHVQGDLADWLRANIPSLALILFGSGLQTTRAAIAKTKDALLHLNDRK